MPRHKPTTDVREANRRWFEYTRHVLGSFAPRLAEEFVRVFEAGRKRHDRASYFAVLADLLAEASHWQGTRGAVGPERSTARRADETETR